MPRKPGYRHTEETRSKIQADALIKRLHAIAMGETEATAPQVNAAKSLLNKVLPDLKAIEMSGGLSMLKDPSNMTDAELAAIASEGSAIPTKT